MDNLLVGGLLCGEAGGVLLAGVARSRWGRQDQVGYVLLQRRQHGKGKGTHASSSALDSLDS
jgi:hypothetical protein